MKLRVLTATLLSLGLVSGVYAAGAELKTDADKLSYTIGYDMGSQFSKQKVTIDTTVFQQGLTDGLAGNQPALTAEQQKAVMENLQKTMMQKMQTELKVQGEQNLKAGEQFLKANKKKPGVKVTKSGLQYKVEEMGAGPKPTAADTVTVDYEGTFIDKKVFDSSYQ
jgi:FKBP-type peptidyl-prolyl cis-trans isomerase FklB